MLRVWLSLAIEAAGAAELKTDEQVVLFPTVGYRIESGWRLELHGCVLEPEQRPVVASLLNRSLGLDKPQLSSEEAAIYQERTSLFLMDNERRKRVALRLGSRIVRLAPSRADGHFQDQLTLSHQELAGLQMASNRARDSLILPIAAVEAAGKKRADGEVHLLEASGLSVISDIDDTIKISQVTDQEELLRNTFCRPFRPVPGLAALYRTWANEAGARFHYVSASPWQLYAPLAEFIRAHEFPSGTFHLKKFRVKDRSFLQLFASPERYKRGAIEPLLQRFPSRHFVLVGDSGEKDPEIFGALARQHPRQISRILIRDVTGERAESTRYQNAFRDVPRARWQLFQQPAEVEPLAY